GTRQQIANFEPIIGVTVDTEKVGIWGHSNGGHISLAVLAITGHNVPTVLWNPVTKPFPYSILYFTDEFDDEGKALRKVVADFEVEYDVFNYSPAKYYEWITAPIQLHQAINDEAVPVRWNDQFATSMEDAKKDIEYFKYPGENHNFNLGSWEDAIERSIEFYEDQFETSE
ncbi:MAG TPA: prolyl oligopeptidase family serine peptidase, partial [Candidatus Levybacteria bacterium]|nr:prolyl oligopeptidase family serine peptidase [Candidatus Levybacteria bacterium]